MGITEVNICLNNKRFSITAKVIRALSTHLILGMEFMIQHNVLLDARNKSITFKEEPALASTNFFTIADRELPLNQQPEKKSIFKLQASTDVVFSPGETKRVLIKASRPFKFYHNMLPNYKFLESKGLEIVSRTRVKKGIVTMLIRSDNNKSSKIMASTTLAYFYNRTKKRSRDYACQNFNLSSTPRSPKIFKKEDYKINTDLSESDKEKIHQVIKSYLDVFSFDLSQLGRTDLIEYDIELIDEDKIVQKRPYRVSLKEQKIINEQVENLLKYDIVEESSSAFSSPVVLVKRRRK